MVVVSTGTVEEAIEILGVEVFATSGRDGEERGASGSIVKEDTST